MSDYMAEADYLRDTHGLREELRERDAEIATLRAEVEHVRAMLIGESQQKGHILADLAASVREAERLRHGQAIEGDYVCPNALERDRLREEVAQALHWLENVPNHVTVIRAREILSAIAAEHRRGNQEGEGRG